MRTCRRDRSARGLRGVLGMAALLALAGAAGTAGATSLLGVTADGLGSILYDVNPATGALSNPRTSAPGLGGLTWLDSGQLVATVHQISNYGLAQIDPLTGAATMLVTTGSLIEGGVVQDPTSGIVYGVNLDPGGGIVAGLVTFDIGTGTSSFVGSVYDTGGSGNAMDLSGLCFDATGRLWALRTIGSLELVEIDKHTGDVLSFEPITGGLAASVALGGLTLNPSTGHFYLANSYNLYDLDVDTGAATLIGPTGFESLAGLAYSARGVPEPGAAVLGLGAGLALLVARRRPGLAGR